MRRVVSREVKKELNWKDKVIIKMFPRTFYKVYKTTRRLVIEKILK